MGERKNGEPVFLCSFSCMVTNDIWSCLEVCCAFNLHFYYWAVTKLMGRDMWGIFKLTPPPPPEVFPFYLRSIVLHFFLASFYFCFNWAFIEYLNLLIPERKSAIFLFGFLPAITYSHKMMQKL